MADEVVFSLMEHHFGRAGAAVVVARHRVPVGARVEEAEDVAFAHFADAPVPREGVGFADVAHHGVDARGALRIADVDDVMVAVVEHRADEVVEAAVDAHEHRGGGLLDDVRLHEEVACLADEELAGLEPQLEVAPVFLAEFVEARGELLAERFNIGLNIVWLIGDFEAAAEVNELEVFEMLCGFEQHVGTAQEHVHIEDVAAGVHVQPVHFDARGLHDALHVAKLVDADAELAVYMPGGDFRVAAREDVRVDADAHGHGVAIDMPELVEDADVVNVDVHSVLDCFFDFVNAHAVGGVNDFFGREACAQADFDFFNGDGIQPSPEAFEYFQDVGVGEGFAGIFDFNVRAFECADEPLVLVLHLGGVINIEGGVVLFGEG